MKFYENSTFWNCAIPRRQANITTPMVALCCFLQLLCWNARIGKCWGIFRMQSDKRLWT